ncbi:hypothetical protein GCM10022254_04030 [Actinomadura meridiana]|uniref:Uncharacterized protein n=1 Tax=Actinomadura meridiana TaxID=559626 RepID=A0ABP8BSK4_9ACTN
MAEDQLTDIAVVGVGCRLPGGVRDLESLWRILDGGLDVIGPLPADRWDGEGDQGFRGCYLPDIDRFDAGFFGITPREARQMDPQQRLLMEVTWEAMQDAGVPRDRWYRSSTSVHFGILGSDYLVLHARNTGPGGIDPYFASGKEFSFAAGRVAYTFGLHGPCMALNTACSSSLVAVHLACQGLRSGEADTALAGGVNAIVAPELSVYMDKVGALSPNGRCRPFDASADGVVRGEGCGVVVLKRLADAVRDHDQIYGVIRGSAVNHDGHSAGLTAPSAPAQEALLRTALRSARVDPEDLCYVEAHGTGTPLGDPLELSALASVIGAGRPADRPLPVGSHKANFGHMDSAAGIAGLLKVLAVLRWRSVPPQAGLSDPSPHVDWAASGLTVPTRPLPLPGSGPLTAGVSAFGLSGTNAHVVLSGAPETAALPDRGADAPYTLALSSSTEAGLRELAADHLRLLRDAGAQVGDIAAASTVRRTHLAHRLAVVADDPAGLDTALGAFHDGRRHPAAFSGTSTDEPYEDEPIPIVYVCSGQGSQWPRMGMDLYGSEPVVTETLDECDALIAEHAGWSLIDALRDEDPARLRATEVAQPAIFAVQLALARLWSSWGVRPDAVAGHSVGEVAAACVAGALTTRDAARLIVDRGRLMQRAAGTGRMVAVELGPDEVADRLAGRHPDVCVATVNGPRSVVLAGPAEPIERAVSELERDGTTVLPLGVDYAFHSPLMRPYGDELERLSADLVAAEPDLPVLSTVVPGETSPVMDAAYWGRNLRDAVLLWPAVDAFLAERDAAFVEIGAHPVLTRPLQAALAHRHRRGPVAGSLSRGRPGRMTLAQARARLHVQGVGVDWASIAGGPVRAVHLPPPRWADDRFWLPGVPRGGRTNTPATSNTPASSPAKAPEPERAVVANVAAAGPPDRERVAVVVHRTLLAMLELPPGHRLPRTGGFFDLGLDSVSTVEFARELGEALGCRVAAADVLSHASIDALTDHVLSLDPKDWTARTAAPRKAAPKRHEAPKVVEEAPPTGPEPVAIIGIGCRLPGGVHDPAGFWRLLSGRVDATTEVPADRWDGAALRAANGKVKPGATATSRGSFLDAVDGFDHAFFKISPVESRSMDPQQRLFLEVAWEALEDAGLAAERLRGGRTGVFVGLNTTDYQQLVTARASDIDLYYGTGNSFSGTAGRLSYFLGLRGPSIAVDTACSSSLTAVHLACQSLRAGESETAVAGGANVMCTPTVFLSMSAAGALAPDGRCKTFDDSADGYGRGEGSGVVVLKTLSRALRDGDRVYAVIRGSAVNQDGASGGFTVPNGEAQRDVVRTALDQAGVAPGQVGYVEAHGTGTRLGDAIELRALAAELGQGRGPDDPLLVGSVKTNVGHLEAAAGITGLIKTVLALQHEEIPAHLHVTTPTRQMDWDELPLRVATAPVPWRRGGGGTRTAGVSAFGFTGTNAHVIVQEPPVQEPSEGEARGGGRPLLLTVSAASREALADVAARIGSALAVVPEPDLADLCWTSGARRTHHEHRATVVGADRRELVARLAAVQDGSDGGVHVHVGTARPGEHKRLAFYYGAEPAYPPAGPWCAEPLAALDAEARTLAGIEPFALWLSGNRPEPGSPTADLVTLAGHLAMTALWASFGVTPDAVVGEGAGEHAAACAAGELTVAEAIRLVLDQRAPADGARTGIVRYRARPSWPDTAAPLTDDGIEAVLDIGGLPVKDGDLLVLPGVQETPPPDMAALLHSRGFRVDWGLAVPSRRRLVTLPGYPWQRRSHWITARSAAPAVQRQPATTVVEPEPETGMLAAELTAMSAGRRRDHTIEALIDMACAVLGEVDDIEPDQGFFDLGMDSVLSARLKADTEHRLGRELPGTVMFECPNAASFADFILTEILTLDTEDTAPEDPAHEDPDEDDVDGDDDLDLTDRLLAAIDSAESMLTEGDPR